MQKVSVTEKLHQITDHWNPRIAGALNGQHVKLAKLKGEFVWHAHPNEDELFLVISGSLTIEFRDHEITLQPNEFLIIPAGVEHKPIAQEEVSVLLFEPATTSNTGNNEGPLTRKSLDWI